MSRRTSSITVGSCLSALMAVSCAHGPADPSRAASGEVAGEAKAERIATGQLISPTAIPRAVQVFLNPGLPAYPSFVAGEAVKSALSPDGKTLAILCAGQNSLDDARGEVDVASSTQFVFLYDVSGDHQSAPALLQVLQQTNAHVGMAFGPDGTLYVSGGKDDAVYVYAPGGGRWALARKVPLGHSGKGLGIDVQPNASGLAVSADGATVVVANNYNDSISVLDTASGSVRYEHDLRPYFSGNEGAKADGRGLRSPGERVELRGRGLDGAEENLAPGSCGRRLGSGPGRPAEARRGLLGDGHAGLRFLRRRPGAAAPLQPGALAGPDGRPALPGAGGFPSSGRRLSRPALSLACWVP